MNKFLIISLLASVLLATSGCSATMPTIRVKETAAASSTESATVSAATATLAAQSMPIPMGVDHGGDTCGLLNTYDLASFFPTHAETILPKPQTNLVDHPIFAIGHASGTETSCVYYTYHLPGSHHEVVLQVNYWLDIPASANPAWSQTWTTASTTDAQMIAGIADDAFYKDDRLSFKKGNLYVTIEATETDWNMSVPSGVSQQVTVEEQLARDMLNHW